MSGNTNGVHAVVGYTNMQYLEARRNAHFSSAHGFEALLGQKTALKASRDPAVRQKAEDSYTTMLTAFSAEIESGAKLSRFINPDAKSGIQFPCTFPAAHPYTEQVKAMDAKLITKLPEKLITVLSVESGFEHSYAGNHLREYHKNPNA